MNPVPLHSVKISPPVLPTILQRTRLFQLLDQLLEKPVAWIPGLPGAGKTTLVASYIASKTMSSLWYQLDPGDEDPATFFHYLSLAAEQATPQKFKPLPRLAPEQLQNVQAFARHYFQQLFNRLMLPFVLVFDDYHEIPLDSQFHALIRIGLEQIPPGGKVLFISRMEPPPPLVRLRLNRIMGMLKPDALRLTDEEATGIAGLWKPWTTHLDSVRRLHTATEGWVAALVLILEYGPSDDVEQTLKEISKGAFFSYFAGEIFNRLDSKTQTFLLKTACLPNMSAETARRLTGFSGAEKLLSSLNHKHFFTDKKSESGTLYQYHPLFREFLLWRGKETYSREQLGKVYAKAAEILAKKGQIEDAIDLYHQSERWPDLADLIAREARNLLKQGRFNTLKECLWYLPEEMRLSRPWLLFWSGACRLPFSPPESQAFFTHSFQAFKKKKDKIGMLLSASGSIEAILTGWEDFKPLDGWIAYLEGLPKILISMLPADVGARVTFSMFSALMFRRPDHPKMAYWADRVMKCLRLNIDPARRVFMGSYLAQYRFMLGDIPAAGMILGQVRELAKTTTLSPLIFGAWKLQEAIYHWNTAKLEDCLKIVSETLKKNEESGIHLLDRWLLAQAVYASLSRNDLRGAAKYLDQMKPILGGKQTIDISHYYYLSSWYHLLSDHTEEALQHAQQALQINKEAGLFPEALASLVLAQIHDLLGQKEEATGLLARGREIAIAMKSDVLLIISDLTAAYFLLEQGKEDEAIIPLQAGLALAKKQSTVHTLGWRPTVMSRLCIKALEAGIEVPYVQFLIRKRSFMPQKPPVEIENWPWAIKVFTLGRFSIVIDGEPHHFSGKAQQKPIALLKMLIASGGRSVSRDHLSDLLWPESEADQSKRAFDTTLHRLRQLMTVEQAIQLKDRKLTLDPRYCWVDVWAMERLFGKVDALFSEGDATKNAFSQISEAILGLAKGNFLEDAPEVEWAVGYRERLKSRFLRKIALIGKKWEALGEWGKAEDCYLHALEVDPVAEEIYRHLMLCYQQQGHRAEALSTYARCKKMLKMILGIEPSKKTETIREQL